MQCPHCQLTMQAAQLAGQKVACPRCGGQFVVPSDEFDPYYTWLGIPPSEQPANHYRLLGVQLFESNPSVIENAADRQMKHLQSFKIGAKAALSQRLLTEISAARVQLLDPTRKAAYDQQVRAQIDSAVAASQPAPFAAAGAGFTVPVVGSSGMRRSGRRSSSKSLFSSAWIIAGGLIGLAVGVLIIFYLTGNDLLGLSGKLRQPGPQAGAKPAPTPTDKTAAGSKNTNSAAPPATKSPIKTNSNLKAGPTAPKNPESSQPGETARSAASEPEPMGLFAEAPRFLHLPALGSSEPESWFKLTREPSEPLTFALHTDAATLPANVSLRIQAEAGDKSWLVEQVTAGEAAAVGQIRLAGSALSFAWSAPVADVEVRRQLANCLLEIAVGNEFRTLALREPLSATPLAIDFEQERQSIELNTSDTPATAKLYVKAQLEGFLRGGKIRGESDTVAFTKPLIIEFADFKGPELELRFVRLTSGKLSVHIKPMFVEAANRKFELTSPSVEKITRAQEKIRAEAQDTLTQAQANLVVAQRTLENLNANPPNDMQAQIGWRNRVAATATTIKQLTGVIANAKEKLEEAQNRLGAVPDIRGFLDQLRSARIKYTIFAKAGSQELVVVDGRGEEASRGGRVHREGGKIAKADVADWAVK